MIDSCAWNLSGDRNMFDSCEQRKMLRAELDMHDQQFHIYDDRDGVLLTSVDVQKALELIHAQLAANLSEILLHCIENQREELSRIHRKVIRDQNHSSENDVLLGRRVAEPVENLGVIKATPPPTQTVCTMQRAGSWRILRRFRGQDDAAPRTCRCSEVRSQNALYSHTAGVNLDDTTQLLHGRGGRSRKRRRRASGIYGD